ncbi:MAG: 2Fe-2S iron-sulfur cluster-binding protein [Aquificaceae bacterium]|nr:2Fe-2S iron-sulfur cluster-binding protein [Aquificaceae bacterium]MCX8060791.1 2Fe-2S iron-sulfur cluster-binding protein [Aquificaceae bacterium]MDW8096806.1 2Fe-2S iron-sulfur cluster-binding protein [Aquificaceae bacterium]
MRVRIKRYPGGPEDFHLSLPRPVTLLELLHFIKEEIDPTLTFRSMCRAGVCGTCGVKLNGKPVLACSTWVHPQEELVLEPLEGFTPLRDLVVDQEGVHRRMRRAGLWLSQRESLPQDQKGERGWGCILCGLCEAVCPVMGSTSLFGGPLLLTRGHRLLQGSSQNLQKIQALRPDLCTHCMNCSYACPKRLMPEALIREEERHLMESGLLQGGGFDFLSF